MPHPVQTGLEVLIHSPPKYLKHRRLGLLCNPASVDSRFRHARDLIARTFPGWLKAIFSPQHGFYAEKQDNMIESAHIAADPFLGIPVFSLYGETRIPTKEMMDCLDVLIIDIQDVGTRVYTFIYTMAFCMEAAGKYGKQILILDRPNPISGRIIEGNLLNPKWSSFVGRFPIPMRHGLTVGELAQLFKHRFNLHCDLEVIPMEGWKRSMFYPETGLPWVAPSPNMPSFHTAMVYPGQVIWEGTNVSEGRGTTQPFECFGAPFIDPSHVIDHLDGPLPGCVLRPIRFEPMFNKWTGQVCSGFQIHVTDFSGFRPYTTTLKLLKALLRLYPDDFSWKTPPYEYEYVKTPIDLLIGDPVVRRRIEAGADVDAMAGEWQQDLREFNDVSIPFQIYT